MKYLSKESLLLVYKGLAQISKKKCGSTTNVSYLRYYLAYDRFTHENNTDTCDLGDANVIDTFYKYVSDIVKLDDEYYSSDFFTYLRLAENNCRTYNNLISTQIKKSGENPQFADIYPRSKHPIFNLQNKVVSSHEDCSNSLNYYFGSKSFRFALSLWILRKNTFNQDRILEDIKEKLSVMFSNKVVSFLIDSDSSLLSDLQFTETCPTINREDILDFYNVDEISENLESGIVDYVTRYDDITISEADLATRLKKELSVIGKDNQTLGIHNFAIRYAPHINNCRQLAISVWSSDTNSATLSDGKKIGLYLRNFITDEIIENEIVSFDYPLQKIVYGAPGTGKSFSTDDIIKQQIYPVEEDKKEHVFRTTFHPDSDYSTFVGCYKPTKEKSADYKSKLLSKEELVERLKEYRNLYEETQAQTQFGFDYYESLRFRSDTNEILKQAAGKTFDTCIRVGMAIAERSTPKSSGNITYDFVPQSFTKAYIKAWEEKLLVEYGKKDEEQKVNLLPTENGEAKKVKAKPVFLVIEEINRGNCAQIFGDLFQLLDREDDGMSCYPIKPDTDLGNYIAGELRKFAQEHNIDIDATGYKEIINGEEMLLPDNLYIWATMNTSDQSLFPIDSAFKRRWDWEYVPISEGFNRKTGDPIKNTIKIGDYDCDWWEFVKAINKKIGDTTKSEDKKLGFYFCKADSDGIIDAKKFVGKVIFYLWNDVFKDYETDIFNIKNDDSNPTFEMFYKSDKGKTEINDVKVKEFIEKVCPGIFSKVNSEEKQKEEE